MTPPGPGDAEMVHLLLENGADVNAHHSEGGSTPLHYAILTGRPSVVRMLLEAGADQNIAYRDGQVAIHLAAARGNLQIVQLLLDHGAKINSVDAHEGTP